MTGFLCALGGVCLQHRSNPGPATYSPPMGPVNERKGSMISMISTEGSTETPLSKFLDRLLSLMVCNLEKVGLQIRTSIKDLVGLELSPALYPMLFNKLKNSISRFFDAQGPVPINDTNTQFVEQTIAIMKNLLDNHTEGSSEHLGQASIETMMLNLVRLPKGKGWNQCFAMNGLVMTAQIHKPTFSMRSTFHRSPLGAPLHQQSEAAAAVRCNEV
ncbi:Neurofibromin [Acipenser ruthenus]|uniref:Neurofibromin n=1 Tax=Acipenser ruthenus TaxID=7906 RepID=A0A662YKN2_ACIRT|nr:Neurofibromin [Acipenser ruthenus]